MESSKSLFARIFNIITGNSHSELGRRGRSHQLLTGAARNRRDCPDMMRRRQTIDREVYLVTF
jgi:hypothetical protein